MAGSISGNALRLLNEAYGDIDILQLCETKPRQCFATASSTDKRCKAQMRQLPSGDTADDLKLSVKALDCKIERNYETCVEHLAYLVWYGFCSHHRAAAIDLRDRAKSLIADRSNRTSSDPARQNFKAQTETHPQERWLRSTRIPIPIPGFSLYGKKKGFKSVTATQKSLTAVLTRKFFTKVSIATNGQPSPTGGERGRIYVLQSRKDPQYIKIGMTRRSAEERSTELVRKCREELLVTWQSEEVSHLRKFESLIHDLLGPWRYERTSCQCGSSHREWFKIDFEAIKLVLIQCQSWMLCHPYKSSLIESQWLWTLGQAASDSLHEFLQQMSADVERLWQLSNTETSGAALQIESEAEDSVLIAATSSADNSLSASTESILAQLFEEKPVEESVDATEGPTPRTDVAEQKEQEQEQERSCRTPATPRSASPPRANSGLLTPPPSLGPRGAIATTHLSEESPRNLDTTSPVLQRSEAAQTPPCRPMMPLTPPPSDSKIRTIQEWDSGFEDESAYNQEPESDPFVDGVFENLDQAPITSSPPRTEKYSFEIGDTTVSISLSRPANISSSPLSSSRLNLRLSSRMKLLESMISNFMLEDVDESEIGGERP